MEVDTGTDVVVIVALTVIPTLCGEKALPCTGKAHFGLGIVYERLGRDIRRSLRLHLTARGHCLEPLIEQHPIHIRRIIAETMPCIYGKIRHQLVTGCFSITVYPIGDRPSGRSPVGKIHLPAVADVSIDDSPAGDRRTCTNMWCLRRNNHRGAANSATGPPNEWISPPLWQAFPGHPPAA